MGKAVYSQNSAFKHSNFLAEEVGSSVKWFIEQCIGQGGMLWTTELPMRCCSTEKHPTNFFKVLPSPVLFVRTLWDRLVMAPLQLPLRAEYALTPAQCEKVLAYCYVLVNYLRLKASMLVPILNKTRPGVYSWPRKKVVNFSLIVPLGTRGCVIFKNH